MKLGDLVRYAAHGWPGHGVVGVIVETDSSEMQELIEIGHEYHVQVLWSGSYGLAYERFEDLEVISEAR